MWKLIGVSVRSLLLFFCLRNHLGWEVPESIAGAVERLLVVELVRVRSWLVQVWLF